MSMLFWIISLGLAAAAIWRCRKETGKGHRLREKLREAVTTIEGLERRHSAREIRQKKNEDKLRSYLHLMDTLINTIPTPVYFKDENGVFQGCNKVFSKQILGLTRDRIIGKRIQDLPEQIPADLAATCQREEAKLPDRNGLHAFEAQVRCADGRQRDFLFNLAELKDPRGNTGGSVTVLSDLTEKNRAARDRLQKEKLEGVLETAGAVCHELNQPLQALSGYVEIMAARQADAEARTYIEKIETQIERMRDITDKLQGVTRYETTEYVGNTRIIDIHRSS